MTEFALHDTETAPEGSRDRLAGIRAAWKFVPNLHRVLAESPAALEGYDALFGLVSKTGLSPAEQQAAFLAVSAENGCEYCVSGHTVLAGMAGLDAAAVAALREGRPIADARLQALRAFAEAVVRDRGDVGDAAVEAFLAAGFTRANVLDVVLVVATKTISNYVNHIARTPFDDFMAATRWTAPARADA
jgi:uncharacterized peroxidase-related enzyme